VSEPQSAQQSAPCARYQLEIDFESVPALVERFGKRFPAGAV
jgi:hypothetical protein